VSAPVVLPAHLTTVRFLKVTIRYEKILQLILATLPEENSLKQIEITTYGYTFKRVAAALDDLLSDHRFRDVVWIQVTSQELDGISDIDYAQLMPLAVERGVLQITTVESIYRLGGDDDDDV
jgi:hypothetical protein